MKEKDKDMNKYVLKDANGKFYVKGDGFSASTKASATVVSCAEASAIAAAGFAFTKVAADKSFAVNYVRASDLNSDGSVSANRNNPSNRRFATAGQAHGHARRWVEKNSHLGYWVIETTDPVNARFDGNLTYEVK